MEKRKKIALILVIGFEIIFLILSPPVALLVFAYMPFALFLIFFTNAFASIVSFMFGLLNYGVTKETPQGAYEFFGWVIIIISIIHGFMKLGEL